MYPEIFQKCHKIVLKNEGGLSNHPLDPGGTTYKGVTQVVYDQYRSKKELSFQSVAYMSDEECDDIYFSMYWEPMRLELLNNDLLILHTYDHGVNAGVRTSIKMLQRLVKTPDDGYIGQHTVDAISTFDGDIAEEFIKRRKLFYVTLAQNKPDLRVFLKGWLARVDRCSFVNG